MRLSTTLAGVAVLLAACNVDPTVGPPEKVNGRKAPEIVLDHKGLGVPVDTLPSTILSASDSFGVIGGVAIVGDKLVVGQREAPYFLVLDRATGTMVRSFGRMGEGPGEFRMAPAMFSGVPNDSVRFWVGSWMGRSLFAIDVSGPPRGEAVPPLLQVRPSPTEGSIHGVRLGANRLLLTAQSKDGLVPFGVFDTLAQLQSRLPGVRHGDDRLRPEGLQSAFSFRICTDPSGSRMALAYADVGLVRMRRIEDSALIEASVPYRFRHHLPLIGKVMREFKSGTAGNRRAYTHCVANDSLVYAFFSGQLRGKRSSSPPVENTFLHVFDWGGRLLRVHHLDHYTFAGVLDPATQELYTVSLWPDSASVRRTVLPR